MNWPQATFFIACVLSPCLTIAVLEYFKNR